jgi:hypothetical protein
MVYRNSKFSPWLLLLTSLCFIFFTNRTIGFAQGNSDIRFYSDKDQLTEGEQINITAWIDSAKFSVSEIILMYPKNNFVLEGDPSRRLLPTNNFQTIYKLAAKKPGKLNLILRATLTDNEGNVFDQDVKIPNIIIVSATPWYSNINFGSIAGVIVGAVLTFLASTITVSISDARAKKNERQKKIDWFSSVFPPELEITRALISTEKDSKYTDWFVPLIQQGYISEVEKKQPGLERRIAELVVKLQEYEDKKENKKIDKSFKDGLIHDLDQIIEIVQKEM